MRSVPALVAAALGVMVLASGCGQEHQGTPAGPPQPVFCDESGMTGNDLLDPNQAFFTYAGVAISFERAELTSPGNYSRTK